MGRQAPLTTLKPLSDINLTPLMDLTFILLITFIITFPLIEQGIPVNLPKGKAAPIPAETVHRVVTLNRDGVYHLDGQALDFDGLLTGLTALARTEPDASVYIRADRDVAYGAVVRILQALQERQLTRIALVTRQDT